MPSGFRDIGIRKLGFVAKTQFLYTYMYIHIVLIYLARLFIGFKSKTETYFFVDINHKNNNLCEMKKKMDAVNVKFQSFN